MRHSIEPAIALLAFAVGCGDRSALDMFGGPPPSGGDDATVGEGPVKGAPSSSGGSSSESGGLFSTDSGGRSTSGAGHGSDADSAGSSGSSGSNGVAASGSGSSSSGSASGVGSEVSSGSSGSSGCGSSGSDSGSEPPSCQPGGPGMTNCGACNESCCTSLEVTGGTYYRTYTNDGSGPTGETDPASVSTFRFDKYDVTVGRFRQFVNAWNGGYRPQAGSGKHTHLNSGRGLVAAGGGYETGWVVSDDSDITLTDADLASSNWCAWTDSARANENLPSNCENWYEAYAFCIWDGGFLPSEAEWEYAAAGGSQQREYPWGSTDPGTGNQYAIYGDGLYSCYYPDGGTCAGALANMAPVGTATLGAGLWGQLDLEGNVGQWTLDWYAASYVNPCADCADLTAASWRVERGGVFYGARRNLLPPSPRDSEQPGTIGSGIIGFRCARSP
jgi:formylglycine-generating enzyme